MSEREQGSGELQESFKRPPTIGFIRHYRSKENDITSGYGYEAAHPNFPDDENVGLSAHNGALEQYWATYEFLHKIKLPEYITSRGQIHFLGGYMGRVTKTRKLFDVPRDDYKVPVTGQDS